MAIGDINQIAHGANSGLYAQIWGDATLMMHDATAQAFFKPYDGATLGRVGGMEFANAAVVDYTRLLKSAMRGDTVTISQMGQLHGDPTTGTMRGNEEKIATGTLDFSIARRRHAVAWERYGQDKAFWSWRKQVQDKMVPFISRYRDRRVFRAIISGRTAVYDGLTAGTRASVAAAGMATGGLTVAALDTIIKSLEAKNAPPLFYSQGEGGAQLPGYAVVMPPDQYADVRAESGMRSNMFLSVAPGPDHPIRSGSIMKYNNLFVFKLGGDLYDGGSPLQPMAKLYTNVGTASGASILYVSVSGSNANLTKYFPASGFLTVYNPGGTKKERIKYKAVNKAYFTITAKRVAASRTSHLAASSVIAQDVSHVVAFGQRVVGKLETLDPDWIMDDQDYGELLGEGLRWVDGYIALDDTRNAYNGIYVLNTANDRTIKYLG